MLHRIEIVLKSELEDPLGIKTIRRIKNHGWDTIKDVRTVEVYTIQHHALNSADEIENLAEELFVDPVLNQLNTREFLGDSHDFDWYIEIGFRPGVTDNAARVAKENLRLQLKTPFREGDLMASSRGYLIQGKFSQEEIEDIATKLLMNPLIQRKTIIPRSEWAQKKSELLSLPLPKAHDVIRTEILDCSSVEKVLEISKKRLLALSLEECEIIHGWFNNSTTREFRKSVGLPSDPTDVELEVIAQTWSEHCKHKIFNADVEYTDEHGKTETIHSLYKTYIKGSTQKIREQMGERDFCLSVFVDNAGVIRFNKDWSLVFKVETHNSPSALDPYGGALTGIVGVNRDPFGTGMGAKLLFNTDVFCFGPPNFDRPLPEKLMPPLQIFEGVRLGVEHGGNHSGIPTVNGAIVFDDSYVGKPLVFCGTGGIMPSKYQDRPAHEKNLNVGDLIVMCGGRIGMDGIHGATFSSLVLDEDSPVSAVQIGDPIIQKRMFDFLWVAREEGLYTSITDNGAGGLSSSVGEMATSSGGCRIHLNGAPLKYAGLEPWEIFISEAQERMTLAVPPDKIGRFLELSESMQVESTVLGEFTDSGRLIAFYKAKPVAALEMDFLHEGIPPMRLKAKWEPPQVQEPDFPLPNSLGELLHRLLSRWNVCSKEPVIRQYDHEVQGGSVIKPLVGEQNDGPADAAVLRPLLDSIEGIAVGNGICPKYSPLDTYHMMACAIDEAIRNVIAVGGSLDHLAGLDNFCWCDPVESEHNPDGQYKMAQLVRANKALYEYTTGFGVPCISGKDSMKNDAILDGRKISILPTVLFSAIGKINDVRKCVTMDVKSPGDLVYLIGDTFDECGGSEYYAEMQCLGANVPKVDLTKAKLRYEKITTAIQQGLIRSNHDCSDGGMAVAFAEIAFAGGYGLELDLTDISTQSQIRSDKLLFSETPSRFVLTIKKEDQAAFEKILAGDTYHWIGKVVEQPNLTIKIGDEEIIHEALDKLKESWKNPLFQLGV